MISHQSFFYSTPTSISSYCDDGNDVSLRHIEHSDDGESLQKFDNDDDDELLCDEDYLDIEPPLPRRMLVRVGRPDQYRLHLGRIRRESRRPTREMSEERRLKAESNAPWD